MKYERITREQLFALPSKGGCSYHNSNLHMPESALEQLFGASEAGDGYKTRGQWFFKDEEGTLYCIYDWKDERDCDGQVIYHIGSYKVGEPENYRNRMPIAVAREARFVQHVVQLALMVKLY